jgi:copper chaperone CopZ
MKKYALSAFAFAALAALALVTAPVAFSHHEHLAAAATGSRTYVLQVEGMTCPTGCAPKVKAALETIEGVESVEVDFEHKRAVVRVTEGHSLSSEACDKAFGNSGYFVEKIEEVPADQPST